MESSVIEIKDSDSELEVSMEEEVQVTKANSIIINNNSHNINNEKHENNHIKANCVTRESIQISVLSSDDEYEKIIDDNINDLNSHSITPSNENVQDLVKTEDNKKKNSSEIEWWLDEWGKVEGKINQNQSEDEFTSYSSSLCTCDAKIPPLKRPLPKSKLVPGTKFTVDAFNFGHRLDFTAYFLTHFHADHYVGLNSKFKYAKVFCSSITYNLVIQRLKVKPEFIVKLPMNQTVIVDNVKVTLYGANHCPGSALILYEVPNPIHPSNPPTRILHTGDFRVNEEHLKIPEFKNLDYLYLDTTYLNPAYTFPIQSDVIKKVVEFSKEFMEEKPTMINTLKQSSIFNYFTNKVEINYLNRKKLILVGTYLIGKERIFLAIAQALNSKIYVNSEKESIIKCFESPNIEKMITNNPKEAVVHVVKMHELTYDKLQDYLEKFDGYFEQVMAFKPTGWTFDNNSNHKFKRTNAYSSSNSNINDDEKIKIKKIFLLKNVSLYGVPYSEHSSFEELKKIVKSVKNKKLKIIPTVKANGMDYKEMYDYLNSWLLE